MVPWGLLPVSALLPVTSWPLPVPSPSVLGASLLLLSAPSVDEVEELVEGSSVSGLVPSLLQAVTPPKVTATKIAATAVKRRSVKESFKVVLPCFGGPPEDYRL